MINLSFKKELCNLKLLQVPKLCMFIKLNQLLDSIYPQKPLSGPAPRFYWPVAIHLKTPDLVFNVNKDSVSPDE